MTKWSIDELLDILDGPEVSQKIFLVCENVIWNNKGEKGQVVLEESLADLAFRMRDELHYVIGNAAWDRACWEVWKHEMERRNSDIFKRECLSLDRREMFCWNWMATWAEPIHWIIAALITKEIETNPKEKFDAHLSSEKYETIEPPEIRGVRYGIAQSDGNSSFGFWDGPNPSLAEILEVDGRDENSVIWRFNADGTDELIYKWQEDDDRQGWMKV